MTVSAVLLNVAPVFTAILSAAFFHERITSRKGIALLINVIGCVLAAIGGRWEAAALSVSGILFGIASGLCYALTAIFGRLAGEHIDPFVVSTYSYLFAALFLAAFMRPWAAPVTVSPTIAWLGFLYALIPTARIGSNADPLSFAAAAQKAHSIECAFCLGAERELAPGVSQSSRGKSRFASPFSCCISFGGALTGCMGMCGERCKKCSCESKGIALCWRQ